MYIGYLESLSNIIRFRGVQTAKNIVFIKHLIFIDKFLDQLNLYLLFANKLSTNNKNLKRKYFYVFISFSFPLLKFFCLT